ncbi:MAG: ribosome maturation factor RimP [bacterium]|nr:ribosome maturation factor RimP [bacterium]
MDIVSKLYEIGDIAAKKIGVYIYDIEYTHKKTTFYIDKEGGVGIYDCEKFSNIVSDLLDQYDFIDGSYTLEVSSPGVYRRLRKPEHFKRYIGHSCTLKQKGLEKVICTIVDVLDEKIRFSMGSKIIEVNLDNIELCRLNPDFKYNA